MAKIENPKNYTGRDLETIFFRPMLSGSDAVDLGIKILYNTPVPTTLQFWKRAGDILQKYTASGWNGGESATKFQKQIQLSKVKAEVGYSADDYFNMVYETIAGRSDVNLDDLSGTELEAAETSLFREAVAESIRATMWLGDTERNGSWQPSTDSSNACSRTAGPVKTTYPASTCRKILPATATPTLPKKCSRSCGKMRRKF